MAHNNEYAIYYAGGMPCCDSTQVCATHHNAFLARDATCARCGKPATGYAEINGKRYCHDGEGATCYMLQSWDDAGVTDGIPFEPVRWGRCGKDLGGGSFCTLHHGHAVPCTDEEGTPT